MRRLTSAVIHRCVSGRLTARTTGPAASPAAAVALVLLRSAPVGGSMLLRIGEFARLTKVSVKMLRHYDRIGLLRPVRVDESTGYRYYTAAQLPRLNRILLLRD